MDYALKVQEQIKQFAEPRKLKGLPQIYRYWNQKYIRPQLESVYGTSNIYDIYLDRFLEAYAISGNSKILSIGSGDCKLEVELVKRLIKKESIHDFKDGFRIVCTELSDLRLQRGRELAKSENVEKWMEFREVDINDWEIDEKYSMIFAHHTLHHIVELERLNKQIINLLENDGLFVTMDMIGRNGHMRWPESLEWLELFWKNAPERYKYNHQFEKQMTDYVNWDCSKSGFEGIRAQDILPLCVEEFDFSHFYACGGVIDVFVERGYGHNLQVDNVIDTQFIDGVHAVNEWLLDSGSIKPTMIYASMCKKGSSHSRETKIYRKRTPCFSVRDVKL